MKNVVLEESGWTLDYDQSLNTPISIFDCVSGGTRGRITFTKSDIRAFLVLFKRFYLHLEASEQELKDDELFENNVPLVDQIKNKRGNP